MFKVNRRQCSTCIYRPDTFFDLAKLENDVRDPRGGFKTFRVCHHSLEACCAGFWARHKDEFQTGQLAQRLRLVQKVEVEETEVYTSDRHGTKAVDEDAKSNRGGQNTDALHAPYRIGHNARRK